MEEHLGDFVSDAKGRVEFLEQLACSDDVVIDIEEASVERDLDRLSALADVDEAHNHVDDGGQDRHRVEEHVQVVVGVRCGGVVMLRC